MGQERSSGARTSVAKSGHRLLPTPSVARLRSAGRFEAFSKASQRADQPASKVRFLRI